jgi:DNA ligase-1
MAQKGLLSFFTKLSSPPTKTGEKSVSSSSDSTKESPIKKTPARKRSRIEDSDSDGDDVTAPTSSVSTNHPAKVVKPNSTSVSSSSSGSETVDRKKTDLLKTPPKRVTARKRTGAVKRVSPSRVASKGGKKVSPSAVEEKVMPATKETSEETAEAMEQDSESKAQDTEGVLPIVSNGDTKSPGVGSKPKQPPLEVKTSSVCKSSSQKGSSYNPSKEKYDPLADACWSRGEKVPYIALAMTFQCIESVSGRLKIISHLANFFRSVIALSPEELTECVYLCLNKVGPAYEGLELGVGESLLIKALAGSTGRTVERIKADKVDRGDLGLVAETSRSNQKMMFKPAPLTITGVFGKLKEIATMSGSASMQRKTDLIKAIFVACSPTEAKYLVRLLSGKLRIGLAEQSVLQALAQAVVLTPPRQEWPLAVLDAGKEMNSDTLKKRIAETALTIKTIYCELPNYDVIIPALFKYDLEDIQDHIKLTPGIPLKPMLAHPTKGVQEVLRRFEGVDFTCEYKYDGERAQIHVCENGDVRIYSRNQENNTSKYPDIVGRMPKVLKDGTVSCVIDSEAVAWDREKKQILPFQVLSTRKRKGVDKSEIKVQVCVFAFDLLFLNGQSLVKEPLKKRRELLLSSFNEIEGDFMFATSADPKSVDEMQELLEDSIKGNCEGLMVKTLEVDASYEIAKRSRNWLKLKKDYLEGIGDTVDLVVVGGYHGTGKRTGKYGGFLLACYDEDNEEYQTICKIGTGFKDEDLEKHTAFFKERVLEGGKKLYYQHGDGEAPDHWFEPVQVWEVKAADLSISPVYTAAIGTVSLAACCSYTYMYICILVWGMVYLLHVLYVVHYILFRIYRIIIHVVCEDIFAGALFECIVQ